ncbi:MAG: hypothetical protein H8E64_07505 [Candidatus Marinimicrobia bacterium]|nr:hypothetical protein [Candidatus Neomarinimicrobiota bacterium]
MNNTSDLVRSNIAPIFHIMSSEQQIIQRTDQKAFTLLSILGVFMVFFIVHFLKVQLGWFSFVMVLVYFISAFLAIIHLVLVIMPRLRKSNGIVGENDDSKYLTNPTFFGGISQFSDETEYSKYFKEVFSDDNLTYRMFANQVYALGKINACKNKDLKRAILFFSAAIVSELFIIMSMAWSRALPFLFPAG